MNNNNSLSHTSWNCKHDVAFVLKYQIKDMNFGITDEHYRSVFNRIKDLL